MLLMSARRLGSKDQCSELCVEEPAALAWPAAALDAPEPCWHQHCWDFQGDTRPTGVDVSIITCYLSHTSTWATDTVHHCTGSAADFIDYTTLIHTPVIIYNTYSGTGLLQINLSYDDYGELTNLCSVVDFIDDDFKLGNACELLKSDTTITWHTPNI